MDLDDEMGDFDGGHGYDYDDVQGGDEVEGMRDILRMSSAKASRLDA